jgi:hypothetical protein
MKTFEIEKTVCVKENDIIRKATDRTYVRDVTIPAGIGTEVRIGLLSDVHINYCTEEDLQDPVFFERSTTLMLYTIGVAIAQIGNNDQIGKFSAKSIADGVIYLGIKDGPGVGIVCKDNRLVTLKEIPEKYRSSMIFESIEIARALFDGNVNALDCIGVGKIEMHGLVSMLDNVNRILDRVALYLA